MTPTATSTEEEMYAYWKSLAAPDEDGEWDEDSIGFLFHHFRPDGAGVEKVFEGVVRGDEILPKLLEVYAKTSEGSVREGSSDGYFIVRAPEPLSAVRAASLCCEHLANLMRILETVYGADDPRVADVAVVLKPLPEISVVEGPAPDPDSDDETAGIIYEAVCDLFNYLTYRREHVVSHAFLLDEAFYSLASDNLLQRHLTWPLFRDVVDTEEPFAPYFELWKHGADYRFTSEHQVTVCLPNLAA